MLYSWCISNKMTFKKLSGDILFLSQVANNIFEMSSNGVALLWV